MSRPGPWTLTRPVILTLAIVAWFSPLVGRPARAMGCHVPERPVLAAGTTRADDRHLAAWEITDRGDVAPPVLKRLPCPGETPHPPVVSMAPIAAACLATLARAAESPPGSLLATEDTHRTAPHPFRLDRPPR